MPNRGAFERRLVAVAALSLGFAATHAAAQTPRWRTLFEHRMPAGYVPLRQFNRSAWITGVTYKPNADVAIKFDYVFNRNASAVVRTTDGVNFGIWAQAGTRNRTVQSTKQEPPTWHAVQSPRCSTLHIGLPA